VYTIYGLITSKAYVLHMARHEVYFLVLLLGNKKWQLLRTGEKD